MQRPYEEAKTQSLPAGPIPRPPPVYPRWLIIGSLAMRAIASLASVALRKPDAA